MTGQTTADGEPHADNAPHPPYTITPIASAIGVDPAEIARLHLDIRRWESLSCQRSWSPSAAVPGGCR